MSERCAFQTTVPLGAMSQSVRHRKGGVRSGTRYKRCHNRATQTITIDGRAVECCGLHKRLHEERGWRP